MTEEDKQIIREVIGEQIKDGFTSGRIDGDDRHCAWELKTKFWDEGIEKETI